MQIKCRVAECPSTIDIANANEKTLFLCSKHTVEEAHLALGRVFHPSEETVFQDVQFDDDLLLGRLPEGTSHIHRQGSRTNEFRVKQRCDLIKEGIG